MSLTAFVLLTRQPAGIASLWDGAVPGGEVPAGADEAKLSFGGAAVGARLTAPIAHESLAAAGSFSPLNERVAPVIAGHVAVLELHSDDDLPPSVQIRNLCEAIVSLPPQPDAVVWIPSRHQATTQVAFVGELVEVSERAYYWIHASWTTPAQTIAVATARGLSVLGGDDIMVTGAPENLRDLTQQLEDYVRRAIVAGEVPRLGGLVLAHGAMVELLPGTDVLTGAPLAELPPASTDLDAPLARSLSRIGHDRSQSPHSTLIAEMTGPYAQLSAAFDELESTGIVARMDFACCQNCGTAEIADERTAANLGAEYPYREHGYVFFHAQDADGLAEGVEELHLAYGSFPGSAHLPWPEGGVDTEEAQQAWDEAYQRADAVIGQTVAATLQKHGLRVNWDGDVHTRIGAVANWSEATFPWLREEAADEGGAFPPHDPGLDWNAYYLLLDVPPDHLGELFEEFLPNTAARWKEEEAIAGEIPNDEEGVTIWLGLTDRIDDPRLAEAAARSGDPDAAAEWVGRHVAALRFLGGGRETAYEQASFQAGIAAEVARLNASVVGLWIPNQGRFELDAAGFLDPKSTRLHHLSVYPAYIVSEDKHVVYTRGMRRLGRPELFVHDPDFVDSAELIQAMQVWAHDFVKAGRIPQAGDKIRIRTRKARSLLYDAPDPITGEPALNIEVIDRNPVLGGLFYRD